MGFKLAPLGNRDLSALYRKWCILAAVQIIEAGDALEKSPKRSRSTSSTSERDNEPNREAKL